MNMILAADSWISEGQTKIDWGVELFIPGLKGLDREPLFKSISVDYFSKHVCVRGYIRLIKGHYPQYEMLSHDLETVTAVPWNNPQSFGSMQSKAITIPDFQGMKLTEAVPKLFGILYKK